MLTEHTLDKLNAMKLGAMADAFQQQLQTGEAATLGFEERFGLLVDAGPVRQDRLDLLRRGDQRFDHRLRVAGIGILHRVTPTTTPVSMSTACSALWARRVRPSFIRVIFASGSRGCVQSSFEPFFGRFRSKRASSARVGVAMPDASASPRRNVL